MSIVLFADPTADCSFVYIWIKCKLDKQHCAIYAYTDSEKTGRPSHASHKAQRFSSGKGAEGV